MISVGKKMNPIPAQGLSANSQPQTVTFADLQTRLTLCRFTCVIINQAVTGRMTASRSTRLNLNRAGYNLMRSAATRAAR